MRSVVQLLLPNLIQGPVVVVGCPRRRPGPRPREQRSQLACVMQFTLSNNDQRADQRAPRRDDPAACRDETLAWLVARFEATPGRVERASLGCAALLVATRSTAQDEETAMEVEHRLRGTRQSCSQRGLRGRLCSDHGAETDSGLGALTAPSRMPSLIERCERQGEPGRQAAALRAWITGSDAHWPARHLVAADGDAVVKMIRPSLVLIADRGTNDRWLEDRPALKVRWCALYVGACRRSASTSPFT